MPNRTGYHIADQYAIFTIVGWVGIFTRKACKDIFIESLKYCQAHKGLIVHAYVIMSSHVHLVLRAKEGSAGLSAIVRDMKKFTSKKLIDYLLNHPGESRKEWLDVVFKYHAKYNKRNTTYQLWKQDNQPKIIPRFAKKCCF